MKNRCPGSGTIMSLSWMPTKEDGYPGAVVCTECSRGVQVVKRSVYEDKKTGYLFGRVKVHEGGSLDG